MSTFDNILGKAEELAAEHKDQVASVVDKATDVIDDKTGHKFGDQLDAVDNAVENALGKKPE
jgi:hypothetical protein